MKMIHILMFVTLLIVGGIYAISILAIALDTPKEKPIIIDFPEEITTVSFDSLKPDTLVAYQTKDSVIIITFK